MQQIVLYSSIKGGNANSCERHGARDCEEDESGSYRIYGSGLTALRCLSGIHFGFASKKALAGEHIALVFPTLVSRGFSVLPGFAPGGELLFFREKEPKPLTPRLASLERTDASLKRADQLAPLKQGPPADESVPPLGQTAGVGP